MKLSFLNPSRSFDASKSRVQFWGYDRTIEISFFVEAGALKRLCPEINSGETDFLQAFDSARDRIVEVAEQIYASGRKRRFALVLTDKDFKD
ncbi:MAG: DUF1488 domain-containing protein [Gammaproteobacteria bacterium]|jgi:hypothetical protein